jgi:hypothetical protein
LVGLKMFATDCKPRSFSSGIFLYFRVTSSLPRPRILLCFLFSNTQSVLFL